MGDFAPAARRALQLGSVALPWWVGVFVCWPICEAPPIPGGAFLCGGELTGTDAKGKDDGDY